MEKLTERKPFGAFYFTFEKSLPELPSIIDIVNRHVSNTWTLGFGNNTDNPLQFVCYSTKSKAPLSEEIIYTLSLHSHLRNKDSILFIKNYVNDWYNSECYVGCEVALNAIFWASVEYNAPIKLKTQNYDSCYSIRQPPNLRVDTSFVAEIYDPENWLDCNNLMSYFENEVYTHRSKNPKK